MNRFRVWVEDMKGTIGDPEFIMHFVIGILTAIGCAMVVGLITVFLGGCSTPPDRETVEAIIDIIEDARKVEPTPTPEPAPEPTAKPKPPQDGKYSTEGSQRLLIKPASDNTGNLVILLPAAWNNSFRDAWIEAGGRVYKDSGRRNINVNPDGSPAKNSNGNRRHLWYGVPGAAIGRGVLVVKLADGERRIERDFGQRTERVEK